MKFKYFLAAIHLLWKESSIWVILSIAIRIFYGIMPIIALWITQEIINEITLIFSKKITDYFLIYKLIFAQFSLAILSSVILNLSELLNTKMEMKIDYILNYKISNINLSIPYIFFDNPLFHDHHHRVKGNLGSRLMAPINLVFDIFEASIASLSLIIFLAYVHWSLVIISIITSIPFFLVNRRFGSLKFGLLRFQTPSIREANYITSLLGNKQSIKEILIFDLKQYFLNRWSNVTLKNNDMILSLSKRQKFASIILDSSTALLYGLSGWIVIQLLMLGKLSVGTFVATGQAVQSLQNNINRIASTFGRLFEQSLYLEDLFTFLKYESKSIETTKAINLSTEINNKEFDITVEDLYFSYPDSNRKALENINFHIKQGETIAIVGDNGSGKSTLIKCLIGLYTSQSGFIKFGGRILDDLTLVEIQKNISVIFQDFIKYPFSVRENIGFGDLQNIDNYEEILKIGKISGVHEFTKKFPQKYDTFLGKILNQGEDLSGGQWQKIAIARALYRNSKVVIFDEPTSSLDPISESNIYSQIHQLKGNKTIIFISHRMAAAKLADKIFVMKNGKIIEVGNHDFLISTKSEYYNLYNSQAKWYAS